MGTVIIKQLLRAILAGAVFAVAGTQVALADAPPSKPGNPLIKLYEGSGGELTWQRSTDDKGVRGYEVTKNGQNLGILDVLSVYDPSMLPNTSYVFTITAIDSAGQRSSVATVSTSEAPTNGNTTNTTNSNTSTSGTNTDATTTDTATTDTATTDTATTDATTTDTPATDTTTTDTTTTDTATTDTTTTDATSTATPPTDTETASISTDERPDPPTGLTASVYSSSTAELFWDRPVKSLGIRYEVLRNGHLLTTTSGISFFDDALNGDASYRYEVIAIDAKGLRSDAGSLIVQIPTQPGSVTDQGPEEQTGSTHLTLTQLLPDRSSVFGTDITAFPEPTSQDEAGSLYWEYTVVDGQLSSAIIEPPLAHQRAWQHFTTVIPQARRTRLLSVRFVIGQGSAASSTATMYYVFARQAGRGTGTLTLYESLVAAYGNGPAVDNNEFRTKEYIYIHEYAHLLSYVDAAIPTPESINNAPAEAALWPPVLGVPADSVFGRFILRFWRSDLIELLHGTPASESAGILYARYPDRFVTQYAATNYNEDFAESFSYFVVLNDQPEPGSFPGSEKVRFFWDEPDLVSLRDEIRAALLSAR